VHWSDRGAASNRLHPAFGREGLEITAAEMTKAEYFWEKARENEQIARTARTPAAKRQLEYLASEWRRMAEQETRAEAAR
jgi:hypothetical protein